MQVMRCHGLQHICCQRWFWLVLPGVHPNILEMQGDLCVIIIVIIIIIISFMFHCVPFFSKWFQMFHVFPWITLQLMTCSRWPNILSGPRSFIVFVVFTLRPLCLWMGWRWGNWENGIPSGIDMYHTCHWRTAIHTAIWLMANLWIENGISAAVWLYDFEKLLTQLTEDTEATFLASKHRFKSAVHMDVGFWRWYTWQFVLPETDSSDNWHISNFAVECEESNSTRDRKSFAPDTLSGWHRKQWLESRWMEGISCNLVERFHRWKWMQFVGLWDAFEFHRFLKGRTVASHFLFGCFAKLNNLKLKIFRHLLGWETIRPTQLGLCLWSNMNERMNPQKAAVPYRESQSHIACESCLKLRIIDAVHAPLCVSPCGTPCRVPSKVLLNVLRTGMSTRLAAERPSRIFFIWQHAGFVSAVFAFAILF